MADNSQSIDDGVTMKMVITMMTTVMVMMFATMPDGDVDNNEQRW